MVFILQSRAENAQTDGSQDDGKEHVPQSVFGVPDAVAEASRGPEGDFIAHQHTGEFGGNQADPRGEGNWSNLSGSAGMVMMHNVPSLDLQYALRIGVKPYPPALGGVCRKMVLNKVSIIVKPNAMNA